MSMHPVPRITVIIPSHNRGARIGPTLDSVLAQTRPADEIIVVNDGGFPATSEFVRANYPSVKLLDVPHGGVCLARNRGAEAAAGNVLVLFDDDDRMKPHAIATLIQMLTDFPEAQAAYADHEIHDLGTSEFIPNHHSTFPAFSRLRQVEPVRTLGHARLYDRRLFYQLLRGNLLQQPWAIYRDTYLKLGGFTPGLRSANDWDMFLRITRDVPIALSDEVISTRIGEPDRPHLTRLPAQEARHIEVMTRTQPIVPWYALRSRTVLRRRIGMCYKTLGDRTRAHDPDEALRLYRHSFRSWPFDRVVAARALVLWPLAKLSQQFRGRPEDTASRPEYAATGASE